MRSLGHFQFEINNTEWLRDYEQFCWLDSGSFPGKHLIGLGNRSEFRGKGIQDLDQLQTWLDKESEFAFGYFNYKLKDQLEDLKSKNECLIEFPDLYFFTPEILIKGDGKHWELFSDSVFDPHVLIAKMEGQPEPLPGLDIHLESQITKSEYLDSLNGIQEHIQLGDIYEMNFCQAFYAKSKAIDPFHTYSRIRNKLGGPMSSFARFGDKFILSSSPERYLQKIGSKVISEPIKGTLKRSEDPQVDFRLREALRTSEKDRAENVMIVDLVRNDLSHIARKASVKVEELCEIYSFPKVHQMISRVSCEFDDSFELVDIIRHSFPMGSMTGAPKIRAMELIEEYESFNRQLYSGSIGYFDPEGNFDFSVLIRTLFIDQKKDLCLIPAGGAITILSDPEQEYEECLLKVEGIRDLLRS